MADDETRREVDPIVRNLAREVRKAIESMSPEMLGRFGELMLESSARAIRERDRQIADLLPDVWWFEGVQVATSYSDNRRSLYVTNLLDWIMEQQRRIRFLEQRVDDLTEKNIELAWKLEERS